MVFHGSRLSVRSATKRAVVQQNGIDVSDSRTIASLKSDWFEDGRDRARILVYGRETGFSYSVMEWILAASPNPESASDYGPHLHKNYEESFLVLNGSLAFLLEGKLLVLGMGDFVRAPRNTRHGFANRSAQETRMLVTFFPGGMEELFLKHRTDQPAPPTIREFLREAALTHASEYEH